MIEINEVKFEFDDEFPLTYLEICRDDTVIIVKMTRNEVGILINLLAKKESEMWNKENDEP